MDPARRRGRFILFHLFYTLPVTLLWVVNLTLVIGGGSRTVNVDRDLANLLTLAAFVAVLAAHLGLWAAALRAARAAPSQ